MPYPTPIYGVAQRWSGAGWLFVAGQVKEKIQWLALDIAETYDNVIINLAKVIDDRLLVVDQRRRNLIGKDHLADLRAAQFVVVLQCAVRAWVEDGLYVVDAVEALTVPVVSTFVEKFNAPSVIPATYILS